ncbi:hypothetical protein [Nostoc sp. 106C]|uniref:hypothetical protein n=1 Tax=Nostoc sp. 106C TaxID=1932667 RepID=UPI0014125CF2|nr:hypothetical protein [Nostoc sp. 106C]
MDGFPTPVRTTRGTPASGWLDLSKLALCCRPAQSTINDFLFVRFSGLYVQRRLRGEG